MGTKEQLAWELYARKMILTISKENPDGWTLRSGEWSPIYINLRDLTSHVDLFQSIIEQLHELVPETYGKDGRVIIGVPTMGAPIAAALAYKRRAKLGIIRQKEKTHGVGSNIESLKTGESVILIDDVRTSGTSVNNATALVRTYHPRNIESYVIVDRQRNPPTIDDTSLISLIDVLKVCVKYMDEWEAALLSDYVYGTNFSGPQEWWMKLCEKIKKGVKKNVQPEGTTIGKYSVSLSGPFQSQ